MSDLISIYNSISPSDLNEFGNFFNTVKKSAFRLEMLDIYTIPSETAFYNKYLAGSSGPPDDFNQDWVSLIQAATSSGVVFERVRLVREPVHSYIKFEVAWGYSRNIKAGENIGIIIYNHLPLFKTPVPIFKDFWLFDDEVCYLMEYDLIGQFLGVKRVSAEYVKSYVELKKEALEKSMDIKESKIWSYVVDPR